jgi:hypothetical protein
MAVAHRHEKIHVLDFFGYIAAVRNHFRSQLSVRNSSIQLAPTSSHPANGTDVLGLDGSNLWNGLVDDLEGKALGERLGDCRESDLRSYFPSTIHYPFAADLGSSTRSPYVLINGDRWLGWGLTCFRFVGVTPLKIGMFESEVSSL